MSTYSIVVFVHVVSAIVLVGGGLLATPAVNSGIERASTISELRRWLALGKPLDRINPASSMILLASGIYLASVGEWWGVAWVQLAGVLWAVNATLANVALRPSIARLARTAHGADGEDITPEVAKLKTSRKLALTTDVMLANDLGVLFLMVTKPSGYLAPLLVLVIAQLTLVGARQASHLRPGRLASRTGSVTG